jgi:hypothetical protein
MPRGTEIGALGTKLWHRSPPFRCSVRHPLESIMTSEPLQSHPSRARLRHLYPAPIGPESIIKNFLSKYGDTTQMITISNWLSTLTHLFSMT